VPVLQEEAARAALVGALAGIDRLVLLGDALELRRGSLRQALDAAHPVLVALGAGLGPGKEVVIVPGNHDHRLLVPWGERRALAAPGAPLSLQELVEWAPDEPLAVLAEWLGPATVRVCYPGVWLRPDVYAIHGHYLDVHITVPIMERLGAGVMSRMLRGPGSPPVTVDDYESVLSPMYDWIDAVAEAGSGTGLGVQGRVWNGLHGRRRSWRGRSMAVLIPVAVGTMNRLGLGPLRPDLSGPELRRAGLRAFQEVLGGLSVQAEHVIFGHTHRAGPLPGDDLAEWRSLSGAAMLNAGSWVYASFFLGRSASGSPYRPGFGYLVEDQGPPHLINLLDGTAWRPGRG
jgi:hypothetical protein